MCVVVFPFKIIFKTICVSLQYAEEKVSKYPMLFTLRPIYND